jgi:hypothetical protein
MVSWLVSFLCYILDHGLPVCDCQLINTTSIHFINYPINSSHRPAALVPTLKGVYQTGPHPRGPLVHHRPKKLLGDKLLANMAQKRYLYKRTN